MQTESASTLAVVHLAWTKGQSKRIISSDIIWKQSGKNTWSIPMLGQRFGWYRLRALTRRQLIQNAADQRRFAFRSWDYFSYIWMSVGNDSKISVGNSEQVRVTMPAVSQDTGDFTPAHHMRTGESSLVALCPHSAMLEFCNFLHLQFWE